MTDTQIMHQVLSQMGFKLKQCWFRTMSGHKGEKLRTYSIDRKRWHQLWHVFQRREAKHQQIGRAKRVNLKIYLREYEDSLKGQMTKLFLSSDLYQYH